MALEATSQFAFLHVVEPDDTGPRTSRVLVVGAAASEQFSIGGEGEAPALEPLHDLSRGHVPEKNVVDNDAAVVIETRRCEQLTARREGDELHSVFVAPEIAD